VSGRASPEAPGNRDDRQDAIMPKVVMYTTTICPYCVRAKHLLQRKGVEFEEIRIDADHDQLRIMVERSRRHTVPQIFIGEYHVGGYDDMAALEARGELDPLLGREN
jgi:glutaredoxin 3